MRKLALTSLVALFAAVGTAGAANVIDGNPLYRPAAGHFYSVTSLESFVNTSDDSDFKVWGLGEEFGYGITNKLALIVGTQGSFFKGASPEYSWSNLSVGLNGRILDSGNWKSDVYGNMKVGTLGAGAMGVSQGDFYYEKDSVYTWTAGIRGGYVAGDWTLAARAEYVYLNTEAFNWGDEGRHDWTFGLDGQYLIDANWNVVAGLEYDIIEDSPTDDPIYGKIGMNYNLDSTKFLGLYTQTRLNPEDTSEEWKLGVKFGIDF